MYSKPKLIIGIILLAIGGAAIPAGLFTKEYMRIQVTDAVPTTLLGIKEAMILSLPTIVNCSEEEAETYFYEQWADGTVNNTSVFPNGFLSIGDPPIDGPPYFELGLTYPTDLTLSQILTLWNEQSNSSLVTAIGVNKWYTAVEGTSLWEELKSQNAGLGDDNMHAIIHWLKEFRDEIVNKLVKDDLDYPLEPYDYGNMLLYSLAGGGTVLIFFGIIALRSSKRI